MRKILNQTGFTGSQVQKAEISRDDVVVMRTKAIDDESQKHKLDDALQATCGAFKVLSSGSVTGTVSARAFAKWLDCFVSHLWHDGTLRSLPL